MTDKELGDIIKRTLEDYQPEYDPKSWDALNERLDAEDGVGTDDFDRSIKAALSGFVVDESATGWEAMEHKLAQAEHESFDEAIRDRVEGYEEPYDSSSWPVLDEKIKEDTIMRRRLRVAKALEVAAVLLIVLTIHNLMPDIRQMLASTGNDQITQLDTRNSDEFNETLNGSIIADDGVQSNSPVSTDAARDQQTYNPAAQSQGSGRAVNSQVLNSADRTVANFVLLHDTRMTGLTYESVNVESNKCEVIPNLGNERDMESVMPVASKSATLAANDPYPVPVPELPRSRKSLRLSFGASADVNSLYMPTEQFYTGGKKVRFNERTLVAMGFSTGAGLVFDHGKWSFETGLYYSSKQYQPNRVLQIGKAFDVRTLDFERISLHVLNIPLNAYWNFDRKGKTRFYAVGGAGFNLIASANYDLLTRRDTRSAPPGAGSSRTDLEVSEVREHILDGAEFSSKSYVTVVGGFGVEHYLNQKLSIFSQPTFNYQVPFFHFSDQNGKHIQYVSVQFGTRIRLK